MAKRRMPRFADLFRMHWAVSALRSPGLCTASIKSTSVAIPELRCSVPASISRMITSSPFRTRQGLVENTFRAKTTAARALGSSEHTELHPSASCAWWYVIPGTLQSDLKTGHSDFECHVLYFQQVTCHIRASSPISGPGYAFL